jgi:hypothetical protein
MTESANTIAVVTENALIAMDLTATVEEFFPSSRVISIPAPLSSADEIAHLSGLLAVILDMAEARSLDLDAIRKTGASIIVLGDPETNAAAGVTYLQLPFTTEMLAGVIARISSPVTSPEA